MLDIHYPDELQTKLANARQNLLSIQETLRTASDSLSAGRLPSDDVLHLYGDAIHALEAYLNRLATLAEWFYILGFQRLLAWTDLSEDTPGKLEAVRKTLFDEIDPIVRQLNDASREAWGFSATLRFLAIAHETHLRAPGTAPRAPASDENRA